MESNLENKFSMCGTVKSVKTKNLVAIDTVPALKSAFKKLDDKYDEIDAVIKLQIKNIKGFAIVKSDLKDSLCESATTLASTIYAFASVTNNQLIKEGSDYSFSDFNRMRDTLLVENCYNLHTLANDNLAALAPFNIDADYLLAFHNLIKETENINPAPTVERSHRKGYTKLLFVLFQQIMGILTDELDKLMLLVKKDYPDFYNHYKNARIIIDHPGKSKEVKIEEGIGTINLTVTATIDGSLLEEVKADLVSNGVTIDTTYSDENGEISFEEVKAGNYIVILSQETFNNKQTDLIKLIPGDTINLELSLDATIE